MITHSYDDKSEPIIGPCSFAGPQRHLCRVCILTSSHVILEEMKRLFPLREVAVLPWADSDTSLPRGRPRAVSR